MYYTRLSLVCALSFVSILCSSAAAYAELIAYEAFDYNVAVDLFQQEGGSGFDTEWAKFRGRQDAPFRIEDGSLDFHGLQTEGNRLSANAVFAGSSAGIFRDLAEPISGDENKTMYLSFLVRPEGRIGSGLEGGWFGVRLIGTDDIIVGNGGTLFGRALAGIYTVGNWGGTGLFHSDHFGAVGETALVVLKTQLTPDVDNFTLYVNPTPGQPEPLVEGTLKDDRNIGELLGFVVASTGEFSLDEIRWGESFEDVTPVSAPSLIAGDADQDLDFDQLDLVQVQIGAKYLTGQPATWGEGDWNGAPGGSPGSPPNGNGLFDQLDIIAAQQAALYLSGPYAAVLPGGQLADSQTSVVYNAGTGDLSVDAPAGVELTSINIDSAVRIFTGQSAENLGGSFDNDVDGNIFKATFGGSFGSVSFGNVAQAGLTEEFVLGDLSVVGSLAGGGDLGNVDLVYVPEPSAIMLLAVGLTGALLRMRSYQECA